ncbi:MAG: phosphonate C-P lyase system protein PhnK [Pseudomonadota bacterium]
MVETPILDARNVTKKFGRITACDDLSVEIWPGEALAVVGESGSGKTTLLRCLSGLLPPEQGAVRFRSTNGECHDLYAISAARLRFLMRTEWGFVHQNPFDGLRMNVSAGGNIGERLMAVGDRHYGQIRGAASHWLGRLEIEQDRIDDLPRTFSGGMLQRLQIARNLVSRPRLLFMDEPTAGLDVSVQAKLLDLLRGLTRQLNLAVIFVTHDLAVARLIADRTIVMRRGQIVEEGLTDRVLDDPQHPYTQLLVASILRL